MRPLIRTFVLIDLKCFLCGAEAGSIEREQGSKQPAASFERGGRVGTIDVLETARVRCARCGGAVYVDEIEIVDRRTESEVWEDDGPRRGRPPKWLIDQRRRIQATSGAQ